VADGHFVRRRAPLARASLGRPPTGGAGGGLINGPSRGPRPFRISSCGAGERASAPLGDNETHTQSKRNVCVCVCVCA
jgi:hypothetical protein